MPFLPVFYSKGQGPLAGDCMLALVVILVFALQQLWWNFAAASFPAFRLLSPISCEACF